MAAPTDRLIPIFSSSFSPLVGDFVFFDWTSNSNDSAYANHVGIVISVAKSGSSVTIATIEGNLDGSNVYNSVVGSRTWTFDINNNSQIPGGYILGFGRIY